MTKKIILKTIILGQIVYTLSQKNKLPVLYVLNIFVKHWPIFVIFDMQHQEET